MQESGRLIAFVAGFATDLLAPSFSQESSRRRHATRHLERGAGHDRLGGTNMQLPGFAPKSPAGQEGQATSNLKSRLWRI